jgi:hypothetical protein
MAKEGDLKKSLKKLDEITAWFQKSSELDVEEGLKKVKEGAGVIKELKKRLRDLENEFEEVKRELEDE